ncbi:unnamed protein product [Didymodactylos carnosus]|uniref:Uncharacterized protein n=1 Tax=Didymodactylos carnosus TaxID=1234261 RepID=A0A8S2FLN2_9BILA|nr:unnamed protein product [Didymodactylos carnosus]CAF4294426.1 unnamed protein product [Didymodactylos carnosus]
MSYKTEDLLKRIESSVKLDKMPETVSTDTLYILRSSQKSKGNISKAIVAVNEKPQESVLEIIDQQVQHVEPNRVYQNLIANGQAVCTTLNKGQHLSDWIGISQYCSPAHSSSSINHCIWKYGHDKNFQQIIGFIKKAGGAII